jgi:hypothetical protein
MYEYPLYGTPVAGLVKKYETAFLESNISLKIESSKKALYIHAQEDTMNISKYT